MHSIFEHLYKLIQKKKTLFFSLVVMAVAGFLYLGFQINFEEDITKVLPKNENTDITAKVLSQQKFSDEMTVMIQADSSKYEHQLSKVARVFLDTVKQDSIYYKTIKGQIDNRAVTKTFDFVYQHLPLFLDAEDYQNIAQTLSKDSINQQIKNDYHNLISPSGLITRDFILKDPLGLSFIGLEKLQKLGLSKDFRIKNGFLHSKDGQTLILFITPKFEGTNTKDNETFVTHLYNYQKAINQEFKGKVHISYFGTPFVSLANAHQIKHDIQRTVLISMSILMLILIVFYRQIYIPVILFIPALCGVSLALAVLYLTHNSVSLISISIGAVLLGITVDYPLHIITHFRESSDIELLYKNITKPLLTSSFTTAIAFLCLIFVNSEVLRDLGVFAAVSIVFSALAALILIPHLYIPKTTSKKTLIDKLAKHKFERNYLLIGIIILAIIGSFFTYSKVKFNNDIEDLNYVSPSLKIAQKQFESLGSLGKKSIYVSVYGDSLNRVLEKNHQVEKKLRHFKNKGFIDDYTSVGQFVLSQKQQAEKIKKWHHFWENHQKDSLIYNVKQSAAKLGFKPHTFYGLDELLNKAYQPISLKDYQQLQAIPLNQFFAQKNNFFTLSSVIQTDETHRQKLINELEQKHVLPIDRKHLNEQFLGQIKNDFKQVTNYSLIAVLLVLLLFFKRLELALLQIIPITLTGFVMATLLYIFQIELNVFSVIVTSLIVGLGVDFSVFMTAGLQKRYTYGKDELSTYRTSIMLAVLTTILALGVLIFAKHPALKSISAITLIGILSVMLITFCFYPILFDFFIERRPQNGKSPISIRLFLLSVISFTYFGLGSLLLSAFGMLILPVIPIKKEKRKKWFRQIISRFFKSVMHSNYGVKHIIKNPHGEKFDKPAIIIANHSSFLDILSLGFLPISVIFLVKDWVYHSPIFGKVAKIANYYPVSAGINQGKHQLIKTIKKGTSIVIFPEGTRSKTGAIQRFHKGAFLLAQTYQIDIIPLYIHGNSYLLPKDDFIIFDGSHYLEIGKRISFKNIDAQESVRKITKRISGNFKQHFQQIRTNKESVDYFKEKIRLNFLYKTDEIRHQATKEFDQNKQLYLQVNQELNSYNHMLRIGDDLGIWDLMLTLQQPGRTVETYIAHTAYKAVAQQSYLLKKRKINYLKTLQSSQAKILLITCAIPQKEIENLMTTNCQIDKIIILSNTVESKVFNKFGYNPHKKTSNYQILKLQK